MNAASGEDEALDCAGAPRDLGLTQGRALRETLRAQAARDGALLAPLPPAGGVHGMESLPRAVAVLREQASAATWRSEHRHLARDVSRHFPQLAERLAGLARGAAVPVPWLLSRLARAAPLETGERAAPAARVSDAALLMRSTGGTLWLARRFDATTSLVLRRSAPEGGLRSLEAVTPCGVAAVAGLNESGLAVTVSAAPSSERRPCRFAAPAALFVQECLQRFDAVAPAAAWCLDRPAAGHFDLWLLDASGASAAVRTNGEARTRMQPTPEAVDASSLAEDAGTLVLLDPVGRTLTQIGPNAKRVRWPVTANGADPAPR